MKAKIELLFIPAVFALTIFVQCVLFHYLIYKEILLSSLWHSPRFFFRFYLPATTMAIFFSSFVFLFKNKWWTVVVSLIFDVWIFANLWYFRANSVLVDRYAINMLGNLNGYWDSILALIRPSDFVFLALTTLLFVTILIFRKRIHYQSTKLFGVFMSLAIFLGFSNGWFLVKKANGDKSYLNPFRLYEDIFVSTSYYYVNDHSIYHYFFYTIRELLIPRETTYLLTEEDTEKTQKFINDTIITKPSPKTTLILCIVESLNSFVITKEFMPNLYEFIESNHNILFVPNIRSQAKAGNSGDGQMTIQTGLLPVKQGAACMRFSDNKYPALSSLYNQSAGIFPGDLTVWNQYLMSPAYGIDTNISYCTDDVLLSQKAIEISNKYDNIMVLTSGMHIPCSLYANKSSINLPDSIPTLLSNYIKSANYTDMGLKFITDGISEDNNLANFTVVITADHALPTDDNFSNLYNYSHLIPLIIYSLGIKQKTIITDTCYQMDIYPTILHLIGCEDYYWKGFGINLLDSAARHNRPITPEEAYDLSDKIIRADYFRKFEAQ